MIAGSFKRAFDWGDFGRLLKGIVVSEPFGRECDQSCLARDVDGATQNDLGADRSFGDIDGFENHFSASLIAPSQSKEPVGSGHSCVMDECAVEKTLDATSADLDFQIVPAPRFNAA